MFTTGDRIASFQRELEFWKKCVEGRQYECFPSLNDFLIETEQHLPTYEWFATGVTEILPIFYR